MSDSFQASNAAAIADALWDSDDFAGAEAAWQRALGEDADDPVALHGLGKLQLARNALSAAALLLERALGLLTALDHGAVGEWLPQVQQDLAWCYYRLDRYDLAAPHLAALPDGAGLAAQLAAFAGRTPYRMSADVAEIQLPFWGNDPLPIVPLRFGDREYPFVIDTGSSQLVIDSAFLAELSLPRYGMREVISASGTPTLIEHTIIPELLLDTVRMADVPAEVMDVRRFAPQLGGLIGTNFLQRFFVDCDWSNERLTLRPVRQLDPFDHWQRALSAPCFYMDSHILLAETQLNDLTTMGYLASGMAGASVACAAHTALQAGLDLNDEAATRDAVSSGGGQTLQSAGVPRLCVGDQCQRDAEALVGLFPDALAWRYGFNVGAMVGHDFFKAQRWGIDFQAMRIFFGE